MTLEPRRLHELPPINPETIAVVRASCARLPGDPMILAEEFYRQLFQMAPGTRSMFPTDMSPQNEKLLQALLTAVRALDRPEKVEASLRRLGASHLRRYGVTNDLYVYVGHALVRAISTLSGHMESSVGSAWIEVYEWLAAVMIAGAENGASERLTAQPTDQNQPSATNKQPAYPARAALRMSSSRPG